MTPTVRIHLLGRDYLLRSQGDQQRVQEAADLVEERLAGLDESLSVDTRDRFVLALLNLAGEYLRERGKVRELENHLDRQQKAHAALEEEIGEVEAGLIARIEDALNH